jgi:hypothetical protein
MKKFIVFLVVFALFGTALFAQVNDGIKISGWGRGIIEPLKVIQPDGKDAQVGATAGYGWYKGNAAGVSLNGSSDKIGFNLDYRAVEAGTVWNSADNAYIWMKPVDILTIGGGKFNGPADFGIRGKIGSFNNGGISGLIGTRVGGEDDIFRRFAPYSGDHAGLLFVLQPVDGLVIGAVANANVKAGDFDEDAYKKLQLAAGYTIPNIGLFRVQFLGGLQDGKYNAQDVGSSAPVLNDDGTGWKYTPAVKQGINYGTSNRIQAAFALTAVEGLTLDIGARIPLAYTDKDDTEIQDAIGVAVAGTYKAGDLFIGARVDTNLLQSYTPKGGVKNASGLDIAALIEPNYTLGDVLLGADIGVQYTGQKSVDGTAVDKTGGLKLGLAAWFGLDLGKGNTRIGVAAKIPTEYDGAKTNLEVSLPISVTYSF